MVAVAGCGAGCVGCGSCGPSTVEERLAIALARAPMDGVIRELALAGVGDPDLLPIGDAIRILGVRGIAALLNVPFEWLLNYAGPEPCAIADLIEPNPYYLTTSRRWDGRAPCVPLVRANPRSSRRDKALRAALAFRAPGGWGRGFRSNPGGLTPDQEMAINAGLEGGAYDHMTDAEFNAMLDQAKSENPGYNPYWQEYDPELEIYCDPAGDVYTVHQMENGDFKFGQWTGERCTPWAEKNDLEISESPNATKPAKVGGSGGGWSTWSTGKKVAVVAGGVAVVGAAGTGIYFAAR